MVICVFPASKSSKKSFRPERGLFLTKKTWISFEIVEEKIVLPGSGVEKNEIFQIFRKNEIFLKMSANAFKQLKMA